VLAWTTQVVRAGPAMSGRNHRRFCLVKVSLVMRTAGLATVAAIGLAACGSSSSGGSGSGGGGGTVSLNPQGSTFQQTIEQQWATKYHAAHSNVQVTYAGTGSTAGIQTFGEGKAPFAGSDVTMTAAQVSAASSSCGSKALTLPVTAGGVAILFNLPNVSKLNLSASTIASIFAGKITKWNDSAIAADNPGATLPSIPISVFHRADGSGTTAVLSGFMSATAPSIWKLGANTTFTKWPTGQGATGSSGVAQGVKSTTGGIGYAETSYAQQDSLSTASVKGPANSGFVAPTTSEVTQSINSGFADTGSGNDLPGKLNFAKMTGYPLSTVSYVLVCSKYSSASKGAAIKGYLAYAVGAGQSEATALSYAPLPSALASQVQSAVATIS
jgi:phosphate transport system substrate-binding protein